MKKLLITLGLTIGLVGVACANMGDVIAQNDLDHHHKERSRHNFYVLLKNATGVDCLVSDDKKPMKNMECAAVYLQYQGDMEVSPETNEIFKALKRNKL